MQFDDKAAFIDPLYQVNSKGIKFRESSYSLISKRTMQRYELYKELFRTFEFIRASFSFFLNTNFLVCPSASTSYFSHSIGSWIVAFYSVDNIDIRNTGRFAMSLREGLSKEKGLEEFLLAILIKNINFLPFQWVVGKNAEFKRMTNLNTDKVSYDILSGRGKVYKKISEHAHRKGSSTIYELLHSFKVSDDLQIDLHRVIEFIYGDADFLPYSALLRKFSIDALDTVNRASRYLGMKLNESLIREVVDNIVLSDDKEMPVLYDSEGLSSLFRLIFNWDSLYNSRMWSCNSIAYLSMIDQALTILLQRNLIDPIDLFVLNDFEFIQLLLKFEETLSIGQRILTKRPYFLQYKGHSNSLNNQVIEKRMRQFLKEKQLNSFDFTLFFHSDLSDIEDILSKWLRIPIVMNDARIVYTMDIKPKLISYVKDQQQNRLRTFYIFSKRKDTLKKFETDLDNLFSGV